MTFLFDQRPVLYAVEIQQLHKIQMGDEDIRIDRLVRKQNVSYALDIFSSSKNHLLDPVNTDLSLSLEIQILNQWERVALFITQLFKGLKSIQSLSVPFVFRTDPILAQ